MNAGAVFPAEPAAAPEPPFVVRRPQPSSASASSPPSPSRVGPLVFASPHSGRLYPAAMMQASRLDAAQIRRSEDAFVDGLVEGGLAHGASLITATHARAFIDVNRAPYELDPAMFAEPLPAFVQTRTSRVAAGLGSIARLVSEGQEIYARKLTFAEAEARIAAVHQPYHFALAELIDQARAANGKALLVDWHSMPSAAAVRAGREGCDIVLGDRFGAACAAGVTEAAARAFLALGYRVLRNIPYAGGYTTELYGKPEAGLHALQIEINRSLYLDEPSLEPHAGFARLRHDLEAVFAALAQAATRL